MTLDTSFEFGLAYTLAVVVYGGYIASLWRRSRRARERLDTLLLHERR
jgi:hypothetical protein